MKDKMQPEKLIYRTWHWNWPWELLSWSSWVEHKWACHGTGRYGWRFFGIVCEYHWTWKSHDRPNYRPSDNLM